MIFVYNFGDRFYLSATVRMCCNKSSQNRITVTMMHMQLSWGLAESRLGLAPGADWVKSIPHDSHFLADQLGHVLLMLEQKSKRANVTTQAHFKPLLA